MSSILIIEDVESQATAQAYQLWNAGHTVEIANTGEDALRRIRQSPPELILLDYELPDTSGLDLFRIIIGENPEAVVIMVTGKGNEELAAQVIKEGAKDYLVKSRQVLENLAQTVDRVLREASIHRELREKDEAIREAHATLEKKVKERTSELEKMNRQLQTEINERKRVEEELRKSEGKYRFLVENAYEGIGVAQDGFFRWVNPRFVELWGRPQDALITRPLTDFIHEEDREMVRDRHNKRLSGEAAPQLYPFRVVTEDGRTKWLMLSVVKIIWEGKPAALCFFSDITDRKQAEEERAMLQAQLQHAQKIEALGTLAGGIAHDFNNILGAIIGNAELAKIMLEEKSPIQDKINQLLKATDRAKQLVGQILTFSRNAEQSLGQIDLRPLIKETLNFLRSSLPTTIDIRYNIHAQSSSILADPTQIHQVLMNLCTNAAHAMRHGGGILEVDLSEVHIQPQTSLDVSKLVPGMYLKLRISDTGAGMDQGTLERIFEPYFTTKEKGEGTGLGLAVTHGIVKSHNGAITVESQPGQGTAFNIYFPQVTKIDNDVNLSDSPPIPTGTERILFIDDEELLSELGRQLLERLGYRVTSLTSSEKALALFKKQPDNFDLVFTDQTMPGMTGMDLAREMMRIRLDIPVIICTGFSQEITADMAREIGIKDFLMKPLVLRDVAEAVRAVLDET